MQLVQLICLKSKRSSYSQPITRAQHPNLAAAADMSMAVHIQQSDPCLSPKLAHAALSVTQWCGGISQQPTMKASKYLLNTGLTSRSACHGDCQRHHRQLRLPVPILRAGPGTEAPGQSGTSWGVTPGHAQQRAAGSLSWRERRRLHDQGHGTRGSENEGPG